MTMTDNPCTAFIDNEHSGGTHHCVLGAGHRDPEFGADHAGPVDDRGVRYRWSDDAVGAVPHQDTTPAAEPDNELLEHVGWWCWRGDNHGHLATTACRSDNVPIHVPADWADEMRAVIQRIEDGDDEQPPAVPASSPLPDQTLRDRIADVLAKADGWTWTPDFDRTLSPVWQGYLKRADAVLAVLPPADRAAVLLEAAEVSARFVSDCQTCAVELEVARELRRLAAETQQSEPDDTDLTEGDIDRLMAAGVPVQIVTAPPATHGAEAQQPGTETRHTCHDQKSAPGHDWECQWCSTLPDNIAPAVPMQPAADGGGEEADGPRAVCVCGHTRGEHARVSGRLLCDECDGLSPDACKEFEAL